MLRSQGSGSSSPRVTTSSLMPAPTPSLSPSFSDTYLNISGFAHQIGCVYIRFPSAMSILWGIFTCWTSYPDMRSLKINFSSVSSSFSSQPHTCLLSPSSPSCSNDVKENLNSYSKTSQLWCLSVPHPSSDTTNQVIKKTVFSNHPSTQFQQLSTFLNLNSKDKMEPIHIIHLNVQGSLPTPLRLVSHLIAWRDLIPSTESTN